MTEQTEPIEEFTDSTPDSTEEVYDATDTVDDSNDYIEVSSGDELWDELDLGAFLTDSSDTESNETDDATADDASYDDATFPSDDSTTDAEDADSVNLEAQPEEEEYYDESLLDVDLDRPAPLSRRKAEKVVKGLIEPLRDPNTPIQDVLSAFAEFHPTRTQEMAEAIVADSVGQYPDAWLQHITGLNVTVDQIKEWAAMGGRQPSNPTPAVGNAESFDSTIADLNELYGDEWRDPANDEYLLDADKAVARAMRSQVTQNSEYVALQEELAAAKAQLQELQPQIESIKTAQEAEFEQAINTAYANEVDEYRMKVENNAIPVVLEAKGLALTDSDSAEVKAAKQLLYQRFMPVEGYGSDFDIFLEKGFSGKDSMQKAMRRVAGYLSESVQLDAQAKRAANQMDAQSLKVKSNGLKEQALLEQDALTVWTRKAVTEFLDSGHVKPILHLLQQNADLQRRLQSTGRPEIVGQTAAIGGSNGLKAVLQQAKQEGTNPFDVDISSILGGR
jgi:hypothetical protein